MPSLLKAPKMVQQDNFTLKDRQRQCLIMEQLATTSLLEQRLNAWYDAKEAQEQATREQRAQLSKSILVKETDPITNITKTFRLTAELIATEQADTDDLELHEQSSQGMEVSSYVS